MTEKTYIVQIHDEGESGLWAEVDGLPGCFASGLDLDELVASLREALALYLEEDLSDVELGPVTDRVQRHELRLTSA